MLKSSLFTLALLSTVTLVGTGCWTEPEGWEPEPGIGVRPPSRSAPRITSVDLPTWPPLGPGSSLAVTIENNGSFAFLDAGFRLSTQVSVSPQTRVVQLQAADLGEGFGRLELEVRGASGGSSRRTVEDLLIDLTPPVVTLERSVVSPLSEGLGKDIALWLSDAFVLGSVEMTFRGKKFTHELPQVYPATLGESWDVTRVAFPSGELADGIGPAVVVVRDAAGNTTTETFTLRIDRTPPVVAITSPAAASTVTGPFDVVMIGTDSASAAAVEIDVYLGGARTATLLGPNPRLTIDPSTLSKGPLEIRAVARDEAGNESVASVVNVTVE